MPSALSGSVPSSASSDLMDAGDTGSLETENTAALPDKSDIRILVVDDEETIRESCASILSTDGYDVTVQGRGNKAADALRRRRFDITLIDRFMSDVDGLELLAAAKKSNPEVVPIMMTGRPSIANSMEALRAGAFDYLAKPFSAAQLQILVARAALAVNSSRGAARIQRAIESEHGHGRKAMVLGQSPTFRRVIEVAQKVAATDASVFITGESGTGKELIAQFIHHHSKRSRKQLVPLNCAALPDALLESEMFGHHKGAFTGAVRDKPGLLEIADGGTMFLDEITEMSPGIQAKLLRVLQDGRIRRVGGTGTDADVDVRFIAATNRDPDEAVSEGRLRHDLYYRLRVVPIRVPPLRERPEDIPLLARHFLAHYWTRHRGGSGAMPRLTPTAIRALQSRSWPGNVRELQNTIENAVVFLDPDTEIEPGDLPFIGELEAADDPEAAPVGVEVLDEPYHDARDRVTAEFERRYLSWIVNRADGNMSEAARIAGIDRTTIYRLMEKHGLHRDHLMGGIQQ